MAGEAYEYEEDVKVEDVPSAKDLKDEEKPKDEEKASKDEEASKDDESNDASEDEHEFSESEQLAYSQGWRPKEEWKGDPDKWVGANEFLFRGELMDRIQKQTRVINDMNATQAELKKALKALGEHNAQIAEKEYNRALASLKKQRREAMREDDFEAVDEIEDRMDELKDAKREHVANEEESQEADETKEEEQQAPPPEVEAWVQANDSWYNSDPIMQAAADRIFLNHLDEHPGDFQGALDLIDDTMHKRFPEEFGIKKKTTGSAVTEGSGRARSSQKSGKSTKYTVKDLNDEQRNIAKTFVDSGAFKNAQEYVDQLAELGELDAQQ